jgi:hypothetical protein
VGVDDLVAERFRQAMQIPVPQDATLPAGQQTDPALQGGLRPAPTTLGEGILSTVTTVGADLQVAWTQVQEGLAVSETTDLPSSAELMTLQFKMLTFSALNEVMSKGVAKATQDLDQLLKTQ